MIQFESERSYIRPLSEKDLQALHLLEADSQVVKHIPVRVPQNREQTRLRLKRQLADRFVGPGLGYWIAEIKETKEFIGWFMLIPIGEDKDLHLGYMINPIFWGQGFATEVSTRLIIEQKKGDKTQIYSMTDADNYASIRVLEKIGFKFLRTENSYDKVLQKNILSNLYLHED